MLQVNQVLTNSRTGNTLTVLSVLSDNKFKVKSNTTNNTDTVTLEFLQKYNWI